MIYELVDEDTGEVIATGSGTKVSWETLRTIQMNLQNEGNDCYIREVEDKDGGQYPGLD